ncbi:MAG: glucose-6-phosphate dehydrogenase assembly protein OpcA [Actinobacteria bacterium]|nr:glucose-6-phosphate dehydrogenase assembly protein OpcA [Actinomycetota bacterium]MBW3643634.1 glucose-6-phosphate dehydrogenase assembly protein OpcA [Actinomycetota bacterium]
MSAGVITVGTWRERSTTMGAVLSALDALRRSDRRGAVRTSALTLLAVGGKQIEVDDTFDVVHRLGGLQPARVVVVRVVGGDHHHLDARVGVHLQERGNVCRGIDDVALEVGGPVTDHLDSVVEPLTLPDLPIVMWCRERLPPARSRLIDLADHLVVDSARAGGSARLAALARLRARLPVTDLAWLRLVPLRRRLADTMHRAELQHSLDEVRIVRVTGPDPERALLGSWLATSLPGTAVHEEVDDGSRWGVTLEGGRWRVEVRHDSDCVSALVEREGHEDRTCCTTSLGLGTEALLGQVLSHLQPDPVYDRTLAGAASEAGRGDRTASASN